MKNRDLTIRTATPAGHNALRGLADRDSARPLTGLVLIAERERAGGRGRSRNGTAIADPLEPSADAMSALRRRW